MIIPFFLFLFGLITFVVIFILIRFLLRRLQNYNVFIGLFISFTLVALLLAYFYPLFTSLCHPYEFELHDGKVGGQQYALVNNLEIDDQEFGEYLSTRGWKVDYERELGNFEAIRRLHAEKKSLNPLLVKRVNATIDYYDVFGEGELFDKFYDEFNFKAITSFEDAFEFMESWHKSNKTKAVSRRFTFKFNNGYAWEGELIYSKLAKELNRNFQTDFPEIFTDDLADQYCPS